MKHLLLIENLPIVGIVVLVLIVVGLIIALYNVKSVAALQDKRLLQAFEDITHEKALTEHWKERTNIASERYMAFAKTAQQEESNNNKVETLILESLLNSSKKASIKLYLDTTNTTDEVIAKDFVEDLIYKKKLVWVRGKNHYKYKYNS